MAWRKYADRSFRIACLHAAVRHMAVAIEALGNGSEDKDGRVMADLNRMPETLREMLEMDVVEAEAGMAMNKALWAVWAAWRGEAEDGRDAGPGRAPGAFEDEMS